MTDGSVPSATIGASRRTRRDPGSTRVVSGDYFYCMRAIGIKELKARLSELLRLVKKGETILVTERDEVVAELRPARRGTVPADSPEALLEGLADGGEVTLPALPKRGWRWRPRSLGLRAGTAQGLLDQIRQDR